MTAPSPAVTARLAAERETAGRLAAVLRQHADDHPMCDRWVTHHSQVLAPEVERIANERAAKSHAPESHAATVERMARAMEEALSRTAPPGYFHRRDIEIAAGTALRVVTEPADGGLATSVERLTRAHFGCWVEIPTRQVAGYLYEVHDNYNDGYPNRVLVLVGDDATDVAEEEFTDSNPAGYPRTLHTACVVKPARSSVGVDQLALDDAR